MSDFFKQLLKQINDIWNRLNRGQKIITAAVITLTFIGLIVLIVWVGYNGKSGNYTPLFSNLELSESASIVEKLKESKIEYQIENDGHSILVPKKSVYEMRMTFAKMGLPKSGGIGYELFDKTNLGMTDFVQNLNFKRALEGELARSIESLDEVDRARVHVVIPKETIFIEKQKNATASVVLKLRPGIKLNEKQVTGIANLVAYAVEGLQRKSITIMDTEGNLLSDAYGDSELAERTSSQLQLQQKVEQAMARKALEMLESVLGPNKSQVKVSVDLNFEQITKTQEIYDPTSKVVRSEERNEESTANSPQGDEKRENSITNYEMNKTVQNIIGEVGSIKRISISAAVDGIYETDKEGKRNYVARAAEEILKLEELVKRAVGYDLQRGDQIVVYNLRFDNEFIENERAAMEKEARTDLITQIVRGSVIVLVILIFILFLRSLARNIVDALNPPVPEFVGIGEKEEETPLPPVARRTSEIVEKLELLSKSDPDSVVNIIRGWLAQSAASNPQQV